MKKIVLGLLIIIGFSTASFSQFKEGSGSLLLGGSYSVFKAVDYDINLNGYGFGAGYESNFPGSDWAIGFSISQITASEDLADSAQISFKSLPVNIYGKYFFGNPNLRGYFSLGIGFQASTSTISGSSLYFENYDNGYAFNFGIGMNYYLSKSTFVNLGYNFSYWNNNYIEDGLGHNFIVGLGFQFN
jgi:opacity protein-like surface antigen